MSDHRMTRPVLLLAIAIATATSVAAGQDPAGPCSLVSFDQIAEVTGVPVNSTTPSGNLRAGAQCTYGLEDRPPTVTVAMARGAPGATQAYESNLRFPNVSPVDSVGIRASWVPVVNKLAVLVREDLYLVVTMHDTGTGGPAAVRNRAVALARVAIRKLGA